ncbi:MAG: hypothetical protein IIW48_10125 [Clostridia bacterium]|nr:hypothetical protein [Clostridia bacterium]
MKARIPTSKTEKQEFNEYIKRNFNLYAERIFQCWAMAMNDAGDSSEKVSETAKKAYKLMTEIVEHRISWKDMQDTLKDEIGIEFVFNNIKFNPIDAKRVLDIIERYKGGHCSASACIEEIEREIRDAA